MIISVLSSAAIMASATAELDKYDPQKHLDASFYSCSTYAREDFGASVIAKSENEFRPQKFGILVWFEFDESSDKSSVEDIRWKHSVIAPSNIYNDSDRLSSFRNINEVKWEISTLSDGHIKDYTHWDKINFYHKVTDKPLALVSIVQEEMGDSDNGIARIELERVHHGKCDIVDNGNAFKFFNEFDL